RGESANILYRTDCFVLGKAKTVWLSDTPEVFGSRYENSNQSSCPRTLTYALLLPFEKNTTPFWVYSIHTDHVGAEARKKAVAQTLEILCTNREKDGFPAYLAGDFNAHPDAEEITQIADLAPELLDLTQNLKVTFHNYLAPGFAGKKIDYAFVTPEWKHEKTFVWTERRGNILLSDHYPIETDLIL
ncbi:MAG: hypothetical protein MJ078_06000, partial [Clostridia bacterium]|nr:hypothetical protein [Clostridia bacterium]